MVHRYAKMISYKIISPCVFFSEVSAKIDCGALLNTSAVPITSLIPDYNFTDAYNLTPSSPTQEVFHYPGFTWLSPKEAESERQNCLFKTLMPRSVSQCCKVFN